jgi:hypothetical protein
VYGKTEVELWLDSREKVSLPVIEKTGKGITKYLVDVRSAIWLKLKYTFRQSEKECKAMSFSKRNLSLE